MRFSQIFLTMGYNTVVKVDKVTEIKPTESGNTMDAEYIGAFKRFDRIPKEIWSARVCTFFAEGEDKLLVVIERDNDEIKISYNTDEELAGVIRLLSPVMKSWRVSRNKEGRYKKAYAELRRDTEKTE